MTDQSPVPNMADLPLAHRCAVDAEEKRIIRKVSFRLLPLLGLCFFISYLDRTNVGVAALSMNEDLGLSDAAFGLGAGLFFIGYLFFEVPSNMVLHRIGARVWISRIMVTWGIAAGMMALAEGEKSFYALRVLLGVAEAGFFPGILLYMTYWFPRRYRAWATGLFMAAVPLSTVIGAPVGGLLLKLDGAAGLAGWQWLFIIAAAPAIVVGLCLLAVLPDRPANATFLNRAEKKWLQDTIDRESNETAVKYRRFGVLQAITHPRVIGLSLVLFSIVFGLYGISFWMPQLIKSELDISDNFVVTMLTALPYLIGVVGMIYWSHRCDRVKTYSRHTAFPLLAGGLAFILMALLSAHPVLGYVAMCAGTVFVLAALPCFWTLPNAFLTGVTAAAGIATVNSLGNLAGFAGPYFVGLIKTAFGSAGWALVGLGIAMVLGGVLALLLKNEPRERRTASGGSDQLGVSA